MTNNFPKSPDEEITLDTRGYRCPVPVIKTESALRRLAPGQQLTVIADDPLAKIDIPHFCAEAGYEATLAEERGDECVFRVTLAKKPPASA